MQKRTKIILGVMVAVIIVVAGAWLTIQPPNNDQSATDKTKSPNVSLDCQAGGYACSLNEMENTTVERAVSLSKQAKTRMRDGESALEAADWLRSRDNIHDVSTDGRVIFFRVEDGLPIVVEHPGEDNTQAHSSPPQNDARGNTNQTSPASIFGANIAHAQAVVSQPTGVVGMQRENREQKNALLLAPYLWDFGTGDETPQVANILQQTRWYKDGVTTITNPQKDSQNVTVEDFASWADYDVVHLSTHGNSACKNNDPDGLCKTYFQTGHRFDIENLDKIKEEYGSYLGVGLKAPERGDSGVAEFIIMSDFIKNYYGGGKLKNQTVFLSACELLAQSDMKAAFETAGQNTDLFAWTYSVNVSDAKNAAVKLYRYMAADGQSAGKAFKRLPDGEKTGLPSSAADYNPFRRYNLENAGTNAAKWVENSQTTSLKHHELGAQQTNHIREVITQIHPRTDDRLRPGMISYINGKANDGEPEKIDTEFKIEGYKANELENENVTITFKVDGQKVVSNQVILPDNPDDDVNVTQKDTRRWRVEINNIEIPDTHPDKAMTFRVELNLPESSNTSVHEVAPISVPRDVRAIIHEPLKAGQTFQVTYDADTAVSHALVGADGREMHIYYDEKNGAADYIGPNFHFTASGPAGSASGRGVITNVQLPAIPAGGLAGIPTADMAANVTRLTVLSQVNEEMAVDAGYVKSSETRYVMTGPEGTSSTLIFDDSGRVVEWLINSADANARITYHYEDYSVTAPSGGQPLPDFSGATGVSTP